jgi:hypothetical protein
MYGRSTAAPQLAQPPSPTEPRFFPLSTFNQFEQYPSIKLLT